MQALSHWSHLISTLARRPNRSRSLFSSTSPPRFLACLPWTGGLFLNSHLCHQEHEFPILFVIVSEGQELVAETLQIAANIISGSQEKKKKGATRHLVQHSSFPPTNWGSPNCGLPNNIGPDRPFFSYPSLWFWDLWATPIHSIHHPPIPLLSLPPLTRTRRAKKKPPSLPSHRNLDDRNDVGRTRHSVSPRLCSFNRCA
ncbi:hypothetical protein B0T26DRAFT_475064 [Lasiosphaeria miniovina]|uniref:Uncharacterized protein n=1 Tax=Lasiosphaeria miniovina TaxID=1954250 RepID=A0AA40DNY4_9PEZI|nr:uncharacterized protein B0T26DRAFT_475064 [Lasiosphaeria miniovina]KAK0706818.1 hypothetical protein B0T26DRAFT_475064 [Lasiosphaeria miniovina]